MGAALDVTREYFRCILARELDRVPELLHPDYTYMGGDGEVAKGAEAAVAVAETYTSAFPDISLEIDRELEVGDVVLFEFTARGTHTGDLMGIAPTGRRIEMHVCNVMEVRDGKIVSEHEYFDQMTLMRQLGVVPAELAA